MNKSIMESWFKHQIPHQFFRSIFGALLLILSFLTTLHAQPLYQPVSFRKALKNETRTITGQPGKNYWQNKANYDLEITFNPENLLLSGTAVIEYFNNSNDTLKKIVFRNYPDFYKKDALRDYRIEAADENDGLTLVRIGMGNKSIDMSDNDAFERQGTLMIIYEKVLPHSKININLDWHYTLNKGSHVRTGVIDESSYFISYCFPRIAVYDDLEGWDESEYLGQREPYADFGDFILAVTVPQHYMVWATGILSNPEQVLHENIYKKFMRAQNGEFLDVISKEDIEKKLVTQPKTWNRFLFTANNVSDVAFAISDHYIWNGGALYPNDTIYKVFISSAYRPDHTDYKEVTSFTKQTVQLMSESFPAVAFPFPQVTIIDGLDQMEFPMIVNDNPLESRDETIELVTHEIAHMYMPFYCGTNQTRYSWMDEGWATISEWILSPGIDSSIVDLFGRTRMLKASGSEWDVPLIIPSTEWSRSYSNNSYAKPAYAFYFLREMLGKEIFNKCIAHFFSQWKWKHPSPWDFFYSFNTAAEIDLNWYWKAWFYDFGEVDTGIESVKAKGKNLEVAVVLKGSKPVPLHIKLFQKDVEVMSYTKKASVWKNSKRITFLIPDNLKADRLEITDIMVPDIYEKDNSYNIQR
jgi:Peptidase family M1 domain